MVTKEITLAQPLRKLLARGNHDLCAAVIRRQGLRILHINNVRHNPAVTTEPAERPLALLHLSDDRLSKATLEVSVNRGAGDKLPRNCAVSKCGIVIDKASGICHEHW